MKGKIHSIETMGLVDGPGIRTVVFFQGCSLRCAYCHNPDTWAYESGNEVTKEELLSKILRFKNYFEKSGGGVTCSGGEPLMQPEFLLEFLKLCKKNRVNTAIDTAGFGKGNYSEILKYTDIVILDIKHINSQGYLNLTGKNMQEFYKFKEQLDKSNVSLWIRHVVVPGITDSVQHINELKKIIKTFKNVKKVELLPYHTLGVHKYKALGYKYKLENIEPMDKLKFKEFENIITKDCHIV